MMRRRWTEQRKFTIAMALLLGVASCRDDETDASGGSGGGGTDSGTAGGSGGTDSETGGTGGSSGGGTDGGTDGGSVCSTQEVGLPCAVPEDCCGANLRACPGLWRCFEGTCAQSCQTDAQCQLPGSLSERRCLTVLDIGGSPHTVHGHTIKACVQPCETDWDCGRKYMMRGTVCRGPTAEGVPFCTPGGSGPRCGDGVVEGSELCDDGNADDTDACDNRCVPSTCGDGVVDPGEECDDGNTNDDDACTNDCIYVPPPG